MKAFVKTLIGDLRNVVVVAGILAVGAALALAGHPAAAWLVMPVAAVGGVAWLARHG